MSALSTRRTSLNSRRGSRKSQLAALSLSYDIYCINFYDNGLAAVRDEYINQIKLGLRRFLFVIDLDNEVKQAIYANEMNKRSSKIKKTEPLPTQPIELTLKRIQDCLDAYEYVTRRIEAENSFNMLKYYQRYVPADLKFKFVDSKKDKAAAVDAKRPPKSKDTTETLTKTKVVCFGVTSKEHHKVGKGKPFSKRAYIKDQPATTSILILIIGTLDNEFYKTLIAYNQPLRGIIHFLPEECAYDLLVPRPRRLKELRESIEKIQRDIHSLRKRSQSKTVGIFQQQLPQMSKCQTTKYASEVFDQLCWFIYDVQTLREHYEEYYVRPYNEIDIKMDPKTSLQEAYHLAESLHIGGHYLNHEMPAVDNDDATVYIYLESLMNTFGPPRELMTEVEVLLLANPSSLVQTRVLDKIKVYANAFKSIIKLLKSERLFVEQANPLLMNVISYMDQKLMRNIYHACLEYNLLRRYFCTGYSVDSLHFKPFTNDVEPRHLPKFAKLYLTDDAVTQRIIQLVDEFENYKLEEIHPHVKLYTFRRCLHEVFENQKEIVIPSRLCFRDFTLYEMQNFLKDLVTAEMFDNNINEIAKSNQTTEHPSNFTLIDPTDVKNPYNCQAKSKYVVTPSVFIRPKSLKANKVAEQLREQMKEKEKTERTSARGSKLRNQSARNSKSRSNIGLTQQSSSFEENLSGKQQHSFIGLGPDHPLLTGYNLDDTRQTIKVKTSKYHFEEGLMTLYQEKWNFRQLNKYLNIEIDKHNIHLTNERGDMNRISNNIRIQTPSGIHLRIRPNTDECAKAVLNYPNGLTLYCHDTHSEHLWSGTQSDQNESRRICTPHGCVIVFYNGNDTVLIMRYNGEVYRLYSCEDVMEEQEGDEEETSDFFNACSTQSTYSSYKPLLKEPDRDSTSKQGRKKSKTPPTTRESGGSDKKGKKKSQRSTDSTSSQTLAVKAAKAQAREMKLNQTAALFASIDNELKYLEFIMGLYGFNYVHLKLTTSLGSVVHVERRNKIYCAKPIRVTEWHDYFANESYAMRDDGVRMVWTHDTLKCYHTDGTVINTTTMGGVDVGIMEDEIDKQISSSSSHEANFSEEGSASMISDDIYINMQASSVKDYGPKVKNIGLDEFLVEGEVEDEYIYDYSFETYVANSFLMQHRSYAGTQFNFTNISDIETKVLAADNLQFRIYPIPMDQYNVDMLDENQINEALKEPISSEADPDEWTRFSEPKSPPKILPHLSPGVEVEATNIRLSLVRDKLEIHAQLRKFGCDENEPIVRDQIELKLSLNENLSITFRNWVEVFHQFIKCACPKWKTTYFIESLTEDCRKKGLELFKSVPTLGEFNFCAGNYYIDPEELKSIHARMVNNFVWYEQDMEKFPRFSPQKKAPQTVEFPSVLTTKIYVEIPQQLAYTDRIHLFLYPFDKIKFRKLKHRFNEAVLFHLYPHLRGLVKQEISKRSWRNHHLANKRRLFMQQQRLSLYVAMLKHKVYPNYFQFRDSFYNHVRNIDFFEFMSSKCNEKDNPDKYLAEKNEEVSKNKDRMGADLKKHRKKCPCPKYIKSLS